MTTENKDSQNSVREIHIVEEAFSSNEMPKGTKYMYFDKKLDLEEGVEVVAKMFGGLRRGTITAVTDNGICEVNDKATFINDVLYRIVE